MYIAMAMDFDTDEKFYNQAMAYNWIQFSSPFVGLSASLKVNSKS